MGASFERVALFHNLLLHVLNSSIKVLLIKLNFTLLSKERSNPHVPQQGLIWKQMPISRALLGISFLVPSKGVLPPGSPLGALSLRCCVSRALIHSFFKVPGI